MKSPRLFQELKLAEIQAIVTAHYGNAARITTCQLLKGGVFNTTYWVKTNQDANGLVLRVAPVNRQLLFDFEKTMMGAEPLFYAMLQAHHIPTVEVVCYDNSMAIIEREYIIFSYIPSLPMNAAAIPQAARPELYRQLGAQIAALHTIKYDRFGWLRPCDEETMAPDWGTFLRQFAAEIAAKTEAYGLFQKTEITRFCAVFSAPTLFEAIQQPRMVHADLWEGNVLVRQTQSTWEIAAIIDIDKAIFGDPAFEFSFPALLNADFLQGYGRLPTPKGADHRQAAYQLLSEFMHAYIWAVQYENTARYTAAKQNGLATLNKVEALLGV